MLQKIQITAKDEHGQALAINAWVEAPGARLTREEQVDWKNRIKEKLFDLVRQEGFLLHQIRVK